MTHCPHPPLREELHSHTGYRHTGGVRTTIAKHHGRYSKSDHCAVKMAWSEHLNYAVEIYDFALNLLRKLLKNKVCRILRELIPLISVFIHQVYKSPVIRGGATWWDTPFLSRNTPPSPQFFPIQIWCPF